MMTDFNALAEQIQATDFGHVFGVTPTGEYVELDDPRPAIWAPDVFNDDQFDITIDGYIPSNSMVWEPLTGMTGQYSYNGAVMHESEFVGVGVAKELHWYAEDSEQTQLYVLCVVYAHPDDPDGDEPDADSELEVAGWCILRYKGND